MRLTEFRIDEPITGGEIKARAESTDLMEAAFTFDLAGTDFTLSRVTFMDEDGNAHPERGQALHLPKLHRAAVCHNSHALWTDAASPEDAVRQYLEGNMTE